MILYSSPSVLKPGKSVNQSTFTFNFNEGGDRKPKEWPILLSDIQYHLYQVKAYTKYEVLSTSTEETEDTLKKKEKKHLFDMETSKKLNQQYNNREDDKEEDNEPSQPVVTPGAVHVQDSSGQASFLSQKRSLHTSDRTSKATTDRSRPVNNSSLIPSIEEPEGSDVLPGAVHVTAAEDSSPSSFISQKRTLRDSDRTSTTSKSSNGRRSRHSNAEASGEIANSERQPSGDDVVVLPGADHVTPTSQDSSPSSFISQKRSIRGSDNRPSQGTNKTSQDDKDGSNNQPVEKIKQPTILEDIKEDDKEDIKATEEEIQVKQPQEDIQITTAEVVDEEALEREFNSKKSAEIRNQILSGAATAVEVTKEKTFCQKYCVCIGCALTAIIIAVVLGVTLGNNEDDEPPTMEGYDYLLDLVSTISEKEALLNETTPQFVALNWLAFEDTVGIPLVSTNSDFLATSLVERYVVGLLYFSTEGINWTNTHNFLSNTSICEWPSIITDDNETVIDGVRCNEEGFVDSIALGKLLKMHRLLQLNQSQRARW